MRAYLAWVFDAFLGVSILGWAMMGALTVSTIVPARVAMLVLQVVVGVLVLRRVRCARVATRRAIVACAPSLAVGGVALHFARPMREWPTVSEWVFIIGAGIAVVSFAWLSRSFAVLPALRTVVVRGPYRWLRHPAYTGELLMVTACLSTAGPLFVGLLFPVAIISIVPRILAEERVLALSVDYVDYAARVRYRLMPGVW